MRVGITPFGGDGEKSGISRYIVQLLQEFATIRRRERPDLTIFVPGEDLPNLYAGLDLLLQDSALRSCLSNRGIARAREFSWRRSAERTIAVLEEAAGAAHGNSGMA